MKTGFWSPKISFKFALVLMLILAGITIAGVFYRMTGPSSEEVNFLQTVSTGEGKHSQHVLLFYMKDGSVREIQHAEKLVAGSSKSTQKWEGITRCTR